MQALSNAGRLAMVLKTNNILFNSSPQFRSFLTPFKSSSFSSLQCQVHAEASSGVHGGSYFPMSQRPVHWMMSSPYCSAKAGTTSNDVSPGRHIASIATTDASDANAALLSSGELRALDPIFKIYGQRHAFAGRIVTVKVFEDNVLVRQLLETKGEGRVLVVDGGGSTRCALLGGDLAVSAQNMGWAGIVVNGCVRDVDEINACDIGVRALGSHPLKSNKKGAGDKHVPVRIAGTFIHDGEWLYADNDGILISKVELSI
ncbi:Ribonuclease E inhibitor RraA/Dimethylmenaquinone methyltransferase [Corchorus olitorius]|uniref:4-hydroxy-4-methyl-2-oxoglutarate aldolase n=1 Tax=Corchorus olitorius TaxID=93759 RepID=A0A1R3JU44_9ROSI|nr:Ribonuclease E inhibitor RraA/Dimethylmenaquinone methyltransferase [Corchorus olitorius]